MTARVEYSGGTLSALSPELSDEQIELLGGYGNERPFGPGEVLFRPGRPDDELHRRARGAGRDRRRLRPLRRAAGDRVRAGGFLGEFNVLSGGRRSSLRSRVRPDARCSYRSPISAALVGSQSALSNLVLGAFLSRRSLLLGRARRRTDRRLAVLARHSAAARVRGPQPASARLDRRRARRRGRGAPVHARGRARGDAGRPDRGARAAEPHRPGVRAGARLRADAGRSRHLRPARRRRRPGRARGGGLRCLGGALDPPPRERGDRRPGRARRRGSRTISAFRPASRAASSRRGRRSRPRSSRRGSPSRARLSRSRIATATISFGWPTATRSSHGR